MKPSSQHKPYYLIIYGLIFFASIVTVYVSVSNETIPRYGFYNSDAISIPMMYNDIVSGYSLRGWLFGPAPSLFPDLPLYFFIRYLSGNVHVAMMLYGVAQTILLVLGFIVLSAVVFEDSRQREVAYAFCLLAASACCVLLSTGKVPAFLPMLLSSFHFGAVLLLVWSLSLVMYMLRSEMFRRPVRTWLLAGVLCVLSTLMAASDAIFIVQFLLPVLLSLTLLFFLALISARQLFTFYVALVPAMLLGDRLDNMVLIFRDVFVEDVSQNSPGIAAFFEAKWNVLLTTVQDIAKWPEYIWCSRQFLPFLAIVWFSFMAISLFFLLRFLKTSNLFSVGSHTYIIIALVLGSLFAFLANILLGKNGIVSSIGFLAMSGVFLTYALKKEASHFLRPSRDSGTIFVTSFFLLSSVLNIVAALVIGVAAQSRYFLPTMIIPLFLGWPFLIVASQKSMAILTKRYAMLVVAVGAIIAMGASGSFIHLKDWRSLGELTDYYPDFARCLDENAKERNIRYGLTQYWFAKYLSLLSKNNLEIVQIKQVMAGLYIDHFVNNLNWYNNDFDFVITEEVDSNARSIWEAGVVAGFGEPADSFVCHDDSGLGRKVLVYNRSGDTRFRTLFHKYFSREFLAAELPSKVGDIVGTSRIAGEHADSQGFLTYGPYRRLLWGEYAVDISYYADTKDVGEWDIVILLDSGEQRSLTHGQIAQEGQHRVSGRFTVRHHGKVEIRTYYHGKGILRVDKIHIKRIR